MRQRLGLTEPVFYVTRTAGPSVRWHWHGTRNQYHQWLRQLLRGHLGLSYRDSQPVEPRIRAALAVTLPLIALALVLSMGAALLLGLH
ncbi:hypothetical protein I3A86_24030, partial [Salmonella enterica]|nr:hypothetical protein [Salmonella enterica]